MRIIDAEYESATSGVINAISKTGSRRLRRHALAAVLCIALALTPSAAAAQEERDGVYAGLQLGVAFPTSVTLARRFVNHPTRCDTLLYPPSVSPPVDDPACRDRTPGVTSNGLDPGAGPAAGFMLGYVVGGLRLEMEYLSASPGSAESPLGNTTSTALLSKTSEWSTEQPPHEWFQDYAAHQVFANVYYDFRNDSRWTPFAGAGAGWAAVDVNYRVRAVRKPEAEYLRIAFDPEWPDAAKRAAAGTLSVLDTDVSQNIFGYQLLAGIDYALSEHASLGVMLRWTRFDDVDHEAVHSIIRSHAPVRADGVTPFSNELEFSGVGYQALTVNIKYHF